MSVDLLVKLAEGRKLPKGCEHWAVRTVHPDGMSSRGFRWPFKGWAEAPGPILAHEDACPLAAGDGLCVATTWAGMASGTIPALVLLLCAYAEADTLGGSRRGGKLRLRKARVVDVVDGARLLREHGAGAYLSGANLRSANLTRADLTGADLTRADLNGADLTGANLTGADLTRADLYGADLTGADLTSADLRSADLSGADLRRANLYGADLSGADLRRANLTGANLTGADLRSAYLSGARHNTATVWPEGFDYQSRTAP